MRKLYFLLILLTGSILLSAQTDNSKNFSFVNTKGKIIKMFDIHLSIPDWTKPDKSKLFEHFKNANIDKQKLDSIFYGDWDEALQQIVYWDKYLMEYNSEGHITKMLNYELDEFGNWVGYYKDIYGYDENGYQSLYAEYDWDTEANDWVGSEKTENTNDASGNIISSVSYDTDWETGAWLPDSKQENEYDNQGFVQKNTFLEWDYDASAWTNSYKMEFVYDSNQNLVQTGMFSWDDESGQWKNTGKTEYTYDAKNYLTEMLYSIYNSESDSWITTFKNKYVYDATGNQVLEEAYSWDFINLVLIGDTKEETVYDQKGNKTQRTGYEWNKPMNDWRKTGKINIQYNNSDQVVNYTISQWDTIASKWNSQSKADLIIDNYGNVSRITFADWNILMDQWDFTGKEEYSHNSSYIFNDLVLPNLYLSEDDVYGVLNVNPFSHMLTYFEEYTYENSVWKKSSRSEFFYSTIQISGAEITESGLLKIYPNPASDFLIINWEGSSQEMSVKIYNSQGKICIDRKFSNTINIPTSEVPEGLYIYRITGNNDILKSGKIVIKH